MWILFWAIICSVWNLVSLKFRAQPPFNQLTYNSYNMKDLYIERYKWDLGMETVFSEQGDSYIPPKIFLEYNKHKLLRQLKLRWGFCNYRLLYLWQLKLRWGFCNYRLLYLWQLKLRWGFCNYRLLYLWQLKLRWGFCNYRLLYLYLEQLFILYNRREMILIYILTNRYS